MTRADAVIILLALIATSFSYAAFWSRGNNGERVQVLNGETLQATHSLATNRKISVPGILGDSVLEIRDGRIRFISSPCQGQHCVHSGWIQQVGEFAACLPNRISVHIIGSESRFDAINF